MKIMAIMVGAPGAGKTTLRDKLFPEATVVCPDEHIGYTKENPWTFQAARAAWKKADKCLNDALRQGDEIVVFDATMTAPKRRAKYIRLARDNNYEVIAVYCRTPEEVCRQRNASRNEYRQVPEQAMNDMFRRLTPPELDEGFAGIVCVENDEVNITPRKMKKQLIKLGVNLGG